MSQPSAIIIGAGISGLAKACALKDKGWTVRVLESAPCPGGPVFSKRESGYLAEAGPNSLLLNSQELADVLSSLALDSALIEAPATARKRFLVRNGQVLPVPMGPMDALRTPLFSTGAKLRLLAEPLIRKPHNLVEESVAAFVRRRLGAEILDYAINPLIGGIYAGDPERLSVQHAFPKLAALEEQHRSLVLGMIAKQRTRKSQGQTPFKSRIVSFREGMGSLPRAMARKLADSVTCGVKLTSIRHDGANWQVHWEGQSKPHQANAENLIIAVPAWKISSLPLPPELPHRLKPLDEIPHPPVSVLFLGFLRNQVKHPLDGFGVLIPEKEKRSILGTLFSSSLFPGRAPSGHVALTVFIGGSRRPDLAQSSPETQLRFAMKDLKQLLGISGSPQYICHTHWPRAIPQYTLGYQRYLDILNAAEKQYPNLQFTGNYRHGISVGQSLLAAQL